MPVLHDYACLRSGLVQLHLSMSSRGNACQHATVLTVILLTSSYSIAAAAETRATAGTANRRASPGCLTSWWRGSHPHESAERPPHRRTPHDSADIALTYISEPGQQRSSSEAAEDLRRDTAAEPAGSAVRAQIAKPASCAGRRATYASQHTQSGERDSSQSAGDTATPDVASRSRGVDAGLLPLRWRPAHRRASYPVSGRQGRRSLTAVVASELPRAALEDVLLTDDELAFTESGVEQNALTTSEASPLSLRCERPVGWHGCCATGCALRRAASRAFLDRAVREAIIAGLAVRNAAWLDEGHCKRHGHETVVGLTLQEDDEEVSEHICEHWGHRGELWAPDGRILDVSNAGFEVHWHTAAAEPNGAPSPLANIHLGFGPKTCTVAVWTHAECRFCT